MSFIPDTPVLIAYIVASVVLFITPGPDMSLFLAKTLAGGRRHGTAAVLGANMGCIVHTMLAAAGLSALLMASATAFTVLKIVGALYLGWMAYEAIMKGSSFNVREGQGQATSVWRTFLVGIGINLSNPKVVLFFVTFLPQFISVSDPHAQGKLVFLGLLFVVINVPLSIVMILGAERLVGYLKARPKALRVIDWTFGGIFGVFAIKILLTQAGR